MTLAVRRPLSAAIAVALLLGLAPASASARPRAARVPAGHPAAVSAATAPAFAVDSWERDAYDLHSEDDTPGGAQDLSAYASWKASDGYGKAAYEQQHTFYAATNESAPGSKDATCDQDWFAFDVSQEDSITAFTIEAHAGFAWIDPVIEVYGPTTTSTVAPADPSESVDASGYGVPDAAALAANDDGGWYPLGFSSSVTFVPPAAGRYFFRVRPHYDGSGYCTSGGAGPYTLRFKAGTMTRLAGSSRIQTAIAISKERYADGELPFYDYSAEMTGSVVVANGYNFPDALAGSTLAGAVGGPLLLTHTTYLDADVRAEIVRLGAHRAYILGGTPAVNDAVKAQLAAIPGIGAANVVRVAGAPGTGRIQTAIAVANTAEQEYGVAHVAFIANGYSFPDALAASPMAAYNVAPILLTHQAYLDADTAQAITGLGITDVVVLGSPLAVGTSVESSLAKQLGAGHVRRLGGKDRYETAQLIAKWETGDRTPYASVGCTDTAEADMLAALDWRHFAVAAGWNYPDALGGGAFAGLAGYPILLNPAGDDLSPRILDVQGTLPAGGSFLSLEPGPGYVYGAGRSYVLGGSSAVGDGVAASLDPLLSGPLAAK